MHTRTPTTTHTHIHTHLMLWSSSSHDTHTHTHTPQVYSHNTDKLVEREVSFSRGTGGATLLLHCALDPTLADVIASTYYFMEWRDFQPVSAVLLNQHDLLPDEAELDAVRVDDEGGRGGREWMVWQGML